jgi:hypothetical protein
MPKAGVGCGFPSEMTMEAQSKALTTRIHGMRDEPGGR